MRKSHFSNRIRFNWGYHDAANDFVRGQPRNVVQKGQQNPKTVSFEYDEAYAYGYVEGLADAKAGKYRENSTAAWERVIKTHPKLDE